MAGGATEVSDWQTVEHPAVTDWQNVDTQPGGPQGGATARFTDNLYNQTIGQIVPAIKSAFGMDELSDAHKLFQEGKHAEGLNKVAEWATKGAAGRAAEGVINSSVDQGKKAVKSVKEGHPGDAVAHAAAAVPIVGTAFAPAADAIDQARSGDWAGAAGKATGALAPLVVPALTERIPSATAGVRADEAMQSTKAALPARAEALTRATGPVATAEEAGAGVASKLSALSKKQGAGAFRAYGQLEQIENDPANLAKLVKKNADTGQFEPNPIATPVNMKAAKAAVVPIIARLEQEMPLAQQQSSRGLLALRNIAGMDDIVPASVADQNLSALKQLQRESVHPKTQFLVNQAVNAVAPAVDAGVAKAGPLATAALNEGRALTKAKYATDATLDQLHTEPVRLFNQLTASQDRGINLLRDVQSKAPDAMPAVSRASVEGLLENAASGGAKAAAKQWAKLGDSTKRVLFNPALKANLDEFFSTAQQVEEAQTGSPLSPRAANAIRMAGDAVMIARPEAALAVRLAGLDLARLLTSTRAVKYLTMGMKAGAKTGSGLVAASQVLKIAEQNGADLPSLSSGQPATATPQR